MSIIALLLMAAVPGPASAAPGDLDPGFGTGGMARFDFSGPSIDRANAHTGRMLIGSANGHMAAAAPVDNPDERRVVVDFGVPSVGYAGAGDVYGPLTIVGAAGDDFALARLTGSTPDQRFGSHGRVTTSFGAPAVARALGPTNVVVGEAQLGQGGSLALARYNDRGELDPSFGSGGKVVTDAGPGRDVAYDIQGYTPSWPYESGLVVAGQAGGAVLLAMYRSQTGALVTSFGDGGVVVSDISPGSDVAYDIALPGDGFMVAGQAGDQAFVARYLPTGQLDEGFGAGGVALAPLQGSARFNRLGRDGDGWVAVGTATGPEGDDVLVGRLDANGDWSQDYGSGGLLVVDFGGTGDRATDMPWAAEDGRTAVTGDNGDDMFMAVIDSNGIPVPDPPLAQGVAWVDFGRPWNETAGPVVAQPDGRIVLAGWRHNMLTLVRLRSDGSLDPMFRPGRPTVWGATLYPTDILIQPDGRILVASAYDVARFLPSGELDATFGDGGLAAVPTSGYARGGRLALQPDGRILLASDSLRRLTPSGRLDQGFTPAYLLEATPIGVVSEPDGRILVVTTAAMSYGEWARFLRFDATGQEVQSWAYRMWSANPSFTAFSRAPQGHMFLAGSVAPNPGRGPVDIAVARFGAGGVAEQRIDADFGEGEHVAALQALPDGGFLLVASTYDAEDFRFTPLLAKYQPNGTLDPSFSQDGVVTLNPGAQATAAALAGDNHVVVAATMWDAGFETDLSLFRVEWRGAVQSVLISANSGKVLHATGAQTLQWGWTGAANQRWRLLPLGGDIYVVASVGTGMVLDVGGATANGSPVVPSRWTGAVGQWWRLLPIGRAAAGGPQAYVLVSMRSARVLDVAGAARTDGAPVVQWTWNGGAHQIWLEARI